MMGPGKPANECEDVELVDEFENACRAGDYEFSKEYKNEIIKRLSYNKLLGEVMGKLTLGETEYVTFECKKCGGSGFSKCEYTYDAVCEECGGTGLRLEEAGE